MSLAETLAETRERQRQRHGLLLDRILSQSEFLVLWYMANRSQRATLASAALSDTLCKLKPEVFLEDLKLHSGSRLTVAMLCHVLGDARRSRADCTCCASWSLPLQG